MSRKRAAALLVLALAAGCKKDGDPKKDQPAAKTDLIYPVEVASVEVREVEYVIDAVGSIDAFETVQVTARVAGAVERVLFREGDRVKKGQPLVEIEPARYTLAVRSAEATLARAAAAEADAKRGFERRDKMAKEGVASVEEMETFRTRLETARADVSAARAQLSLAQLNLRDAFVTAPITGVVQTRTVQTGQYLQPGAVNTAILATLVRRDPLLVRFKVAEHEAMRLGVDSEARFTVRGGTGKKTARIRHIAAKADEMTRMVDVIAEVANDDPELRPGSFAEVQIPNGGAKAAVVPQTAVRPSDRGFLAFVIADGKAIEHVVHIGRRTAGGLVEVLDGLKDGDQVVVRGAEALTDGAPVKIAPSTAASAAAAGASAAPEPPPPTASASGAPRSRPDASASADATTPAKAP